MNNIKIQMWREILEKCIEIRAFEQAIERVYQEDIIQSPVHLSIGQELTSVMMGKLKEKNDWVIGNYRSHALTLSVSNNENEIIKELCGKAEGMFGGKAGSMHLGDPQANMPWTSAIVGSGVPIAAGVAEGVKRDEGRNLVAVQFGDGAMEEGCVYETLNIASLYKLPIVFIMENNGLAIYSRQNARIGSKKEYRSKAECHGIQTFTTTTKTPVKMWETMKSAYKYCRDNCKPVFVEVKCYRYRQHVGIGEDFDMGYRSKQEITEWEESDIILNPSLIGIGIDTNTELEKKTRKYVERLRQSSTQGGV